LVQPDKKISSFITACLLKDLREKFVQIRHKHAITFCGRPFKAFTYYLTSSYRNHSKPSRNLEMRRTALQPYSVQHNDLTDNAGPNTQRTIGSLED
jgi:hypothetical protein